jgi:Transposase DDE domain
MDDNSIKEANNELEPICADDWEVIVNHLPEGWEAHAKESGALKRSRAFESPEKLLRTLLIHLAEGCSLRETAVRAREGKIADVSDVAILKRLRESEVWLLWMAYELARPHGYSQIPDAKGRYHVRIIDATTVSEPGSTGTDWRLHYSLELKTLRCDHFEITDIKGGETFKRIPVRSGDLIIGDRCYEGIDGIRHILDSSGDVIVRMRLTGPSIETPEGQDFKLLKRLKTLKVGETREWDVRLTAANKEPVYGRLCAIRRSKNAASLAEKKLRKESLRKSKNVSNDAIQATRYVFVFTTVPVDLLNTCEVLELYRARWQIEMSFKRLKSIIDLGHLPKYDKRSCRAWLYGKLLVALLAERMLDTGRRFSPWGYNLDGGAYNYFELH